MPALALVEDELPLAPFVHALPDPAGIIDRETSDLQGLAAIREALISGVSHEVRGALTTIAGSAETLPGTDAPTRALAQNIERASLRLLRILDDTIRVVRLEGGEPDPTLVPLLVEPICRRAAAALGGPERICVDLPASLRALADPRALERIVTVFLETALRWGEPGRPVTLSAARAGSSVVLAVAAEGTPWAEPRARLFELFAVRGEGASGLELAIARGLSRTLRGEVGAEDGRLWLRLRAVPAA